MKSRPKTFAYLADGREVRTIILYGSPLNPSYNPKRGRPFALIGCPMDADLRECPGYGSPELFCGAIGHVGAEALLSFALEPADADFHVVRSNVPLDN